MNNECRSLKSRKENSYVKFKIKGIDFEQFAAVDGYWLEHGKII